MIFYFDVDFYQGREYGVLTVRHPKPASDGPGFESEVNVSRFHLRIGSALGGEMLHE